MTVFRHAHNHHLPDVANIEFGDGIDLFEPHSRTICRMASMLVVTEQRLHMAISLAEVTLEVARQICTAG